MCKDFFEHLFSALLGLYLGAELLGLYVLFLVFCPLSSVQHTDSEIVPCGSMQLQGSEVGPFSWLSSVPSCDWCSFIGHLLADTHLSCFQHGALRNNATKNIRVQSL